MQTFGQIPHLPSCRGLRRLLSRIRSLPGEQNLSDALVGRPDPIQKRACAFNDHLINQAVLGFHRPTGGLGQGYPTKTQFANSAGCGNGAFTLSSICVPTPAFDNPFPDVIVTGPLSLENPTQSIGFNLGGNGQGLRIAQNFYDVSDSVTFVHGAHSLHFGGGINRSQINFGNFHYFGGLYYPTFADFLM